MALYQIITFFLLLLFLPLFPQNFSQSQQILYSIHTGDLKNTLKLYQKYKEQTGKHDIELVQQIGLILLDQGHRSNDSQIKLMALFGAGISTNERCMYILEEALDSPSPELQLVALGYLARFHHDRADESLNKALAANHLLIRLEALLHLAEKKHPKAVGQTEALMAKVPKELLPIFPQFFAIIGDSASTRVLKRLLSYPNEKVRVAAILTAGKFERDDLLPQIRKLAAQHAVIQQEACAIAMGMLKDESSIPRLNALANSSSLNTRLAAFQALYKLGKKERRNDIEQEAKTGNLFAIAMLGEMAGSEELLFQLSKNSNLQIRINAALSLLARKDSRCLIPLTEILLKDSRDLAFTKISTLSGGLSAWKTIPSSSQNFKDDPSCFEESLDLKETVLEKALNLPPDHFLALAEAIFETHQNDLIPLLADLLENMESPAAIAFLKKYHQKAGAPLIRNYCNLALFNLGEEGPYADNLKKWIAREQEEDFIRFRSKKAILSHDLISHYDLDPEDTSKLLIRSFESFAKTQDDNGIDVLLDALLNGNEKNRYALAGLLIRATM